MLIYLVFTLSVTFYSVNSQLRLFSDFVFDSKDKINSGKYGSSYIAYDKNDNSTKYIFKTSNYTSNDNEMSNLHYISKQDPKNRENLPVLISYKVLLNSSFDTIEYDYILDYIPFTLNEYIASFIKNYGIVSYWKNKYTIITKITYYLLNALSELDRLAIIHRNIIPKNIYVNEHGIPVLENFCVSTRLNYSNEISYDYHFNILSAPPEFFFQDGITTKSDVFSLGMVIYYLTIEKKWPKDNLMNFQERMILFNQNRFFHFENEFFEGVKGIVNLKSMLQVDMLVSSDKRLSAKELIVKYYPQNVLSSLNID